MGAIDCFPPLWSVSHCYGVFLSSIECQGWVLSSTKECFFLQWSVSLFGGVFSHVMEYIPLLWCVSLCGEVFSSAMECFPPLKVFLSTLTHFPAFFSVFLHFGLFPCILDGFLPLWNVSVHNYGCFPQLLSVLLHFRVVFFHFGEFLPMMECFPVQ